MADNSKIRVDKLGDIIEICLDRAKAFGTSSRDEARSFFQGVINEYYVQVCTERNWNWRKFWRSIVFKQPITTGTVSVTNASRTALFSVLIEGNSMLGKTLQVVGRNELYRIVGVSSSLGEVYLEAPYVGSTDATATFKLYQYEFALPPDCDNVIQVYVDGQLERNGELDFKNPLEFNRMLATNVSPISGAPSYWTQDGKTFINASLPQLDVMVLDFDFMAGDDTEKASAIRFFPIAPEADKLVHVEHTVDPEPMSDDTDIPLMPASDRWCLIHFALYEWHKQNGNLALSKEEQSCAEKILKIMRAEYKKADAHPQLILGASRYRRRSLDERSDDEFRAARIAEGSY